MKKTTATLPVNTLPLEVRDSISTLLGRTFKEPVQTGDFKIVAGGCINHGGVINSSVGSFFVKWNDVHSNPDMFSTEGSGLLTLRNTNIVRVPNVIGTGYTDHYQFIVLENLVGKPASDQFWHLLGTQLAGIHATTAAAFGLDHDNYIGSLRQVNTPSNSWISFFINERLGRQLMLAEQNGMADFTHRKRFDLLFEKLPSLLPVGTPSLLHGDLWGGNVITDEAGHPALIDPAVYYGDAEIEIAYTRLFGGFDQKFYDAYFALRPMQSGFEDRAAIYNLYPLLVHANLFGRKYLLLIDEILNRFV